MNDLPESADVLRTTAEGVPYTVALDDFQMTDVEGDTTPTAVRIDTLPTDGTLLLNGVPVTAGQVIPASAISSGQLVFVPNGRPVRAARLMAASLSPFKTALAASTPRPTPSP